MKTGHIQRTQHGTLIEMLLKWTFLHLKFNIGNLICKIISRKLITKRKVKDEIRHLFGAFYMPKLSRLTHCFMRGFGTKTRALSTAKSPRRSAYHTNVLIAQYLLEYGSSQAVPRACQFQDLQGRRHGAQYLEQNLPLSNQPTWENALSSQIVSLHQKNAKWQSKQSPEDRRTQFRSTFETISIPSHSF